MKRHIAEVFWLIVVKTTQCAELLMVKRFTYLFIYFFFATDHLSFWLSHLCQNVNFLQVQILDSVKILGSGQCILAVFYGKIGKKCNKCNKSKSLFKYSYKSSCFIYLQNG